MTTLQDVWKGPKMDKCNFCGRSHGWTTLIEGDTGKTICDQCISLCVLTLERTSIEQRIAGLRNVMNDAIEFERAKKRLAEMEVEIREMRP